MEKQFGQTEDKLLRYAESTFQPEDAVLAEVRERAKRLEIPAIHVGRMDGLHLEVLVRASGARKAVEIGTLAGYSGICIARALPRDGRLHTFEFEPRHAAAAAESFRKAGVDGQVEILVGPAIQNLPRIESQGPFDLVFIDADKVSYPAYFDWAERNLRVGGVIIADNTFAWGMIADDTFEKPDHEAAAVALREFNRRCAAGGRFRATILPTGEGLTVAVKIR